MFVLHIYRKFVGFDLNVVIKQERQKLTNHSVVGTNNTKQVRISFDVPP